MKDESNIIKEEWKQLLIDRKAYCYIKPNRLIHESGWRCFEVGYCTLNNKDKVDRKLVLSNGSDHFWHVGDILTKEPALEFSMDITRDGYIRVFSRKILTWENNYSWVCSSFSLGEMR